MDPNFPVKSKIYHKGDKVICVDIGSKGMYMVKGTVKYFGPVKNKTGKYVGVEFEKNIRKKTNVRAYFNSKSGNGALVKTTALRKIKKPFNLKEFISHFEASLPSLTKKMSQSSFAQHESQTNLSRPASKKQMKREKSSHDMEKSTKKLPPAKKSEKQLIIQKSEEVEEESKREIHINEYARAEDSGEIKKLMIRNGELEEEKKKAFFELKNIQIQNSELMVQNQKKDQDIKILENKMEVLQQNYDYLLNKDDQNENQEENLKALEEYTKLKQDYEKVVQEKVSLESELLQFADYEEFKKKFENNSIQIESMKTELEKFKTQAEQSKDIITGLQEQVEIYELEMDLAARGDEIPEDPEELKKNYLMMKSAFDKVDMDLEIQKMEFEDKITALNTQIADLNRKNINILSSDEVKKLMEKKEKEIEECYKLIDQYSQSNKMVETLSESIQKKEDDINKQKENIASLMEKIQILEEENVLMDEILKENEETLEIELKKITSLQDQVEQVTNEKEALKNKLSQYQSQVDQLNEQKSNLEFESSQIQNENEIQSDMFNQLNRVMRQKQNKVKEDMTQQMQSRENLWQNIQSKVYLSSVPEEIQQKLKMEQYEKLRTLQVTNDQIDISIYQLIKGFIFNDTIKNDNQNLHGVSKDLFIQCLEFQDYLNLLRAQYKNSKSKEDIKIIQQSNLESEVFQNIQLTQDLFKQLKNNDFSPNFCFSGYMESNLKLKDEEGLESEDLNFLYKKNINKILKNLVEAYESDSISNEDKNLVKALMHKIFFMSQHIYQMEIDQNLVERSGSYAENVKERISEFNMWFKTVYNKIPDKLKKLDQLTEELSQGHWRVEIEEVRGELSQMKTMKENINILTEEKTGLESQVQEKMKEVQTHQKMKLDLDNKLMKLQAKANKVTTLELQLKEAEKQRKTQSKKIQELKKSQKSMENISSPGIMGTNNVKTNSGQNNIKKLKQTLRRNSNIKNLFSTNASKDGKSFQIRKDYEPTEKFEINSLNGIVNNLVNRIKRYQKTITNTELKEFKQKTPHFQQYIQKKFSDKVHLPMVKESVGYLKQCNNLIKKSISRMEVIDEKKDVSRQIKRYFGLQNQVTSCYQNAQQMLSESIENEIPELDLGYKINFKEELFTKREDSDKQVYGRIKLLSEKSLVPNEPLKSINLDLEFK